MKERPILFSSPMVRAIMESRKTMTRRIIKPQEICNALIENGGVVGLYHPAKVDRQGELYPGPERFGISNEDYSIACPYGQPGDRLWVKETFVPDYFDDHKPGYKADWNNVAAEYVPEPKWKPSIFMPRSTSRILLEITSVRVERLQDISAEEARKEGVSDLLEFTDLWGSINGIESWYINPWVWVIEFKQSNNNSHGNHSTQ